MKSKYKSSPSRIQATVRSKDINSHGYSVAGFNELDIPVRREAETGKLVSIDRKSKTKKSFK